MSKKIVSGIVASSFAACLAAACGSSADRAFEPDPPGGSSGTSGEGSSGTSGSLGTSGGTSGSSGQDSGLGTCAADTQSAKALPLDIFIMLDSSGSMADLTGGSGSPSKWTSVKTALGTFINDAKSAGIGVGLQHFPIDHAGAPASCLTAADCKVGGTDYGHCNAKVCPPGADGLLVGCDTPADCGGAACRDLGQCTVGGILGLGSLCLVGDSCGLLATCTKFTAGSCESQECFASDYSQALVPIATLPASAGSLTSHINALPDPTGGTPTSAAVTGGLAYTKQFAAANPTHVVVMVLATDGLPSACAPVDAAGIAAIAKAAATATPSVKTFVVGVAIDAPTTANLDAIALAGGTTKSINVTTGATAEFQAALEGIRSQALPCEYTVPTPTSGTPDYDKVNVQFTSGTGAPAVLGYKKNAAACDAGGGWYYDADPAGGATPTKILLCPASCDGVKKGSSTAKLDILLGCKTVVK